MIWTMYWPICGALWMTPSPRLSRSLCAGPDGQSPLLAKDGDTELNFTPLRERMRELVQGATQVVRQRMLSELYAIDMQSNAALRALPGWQEPADNRMNTSAVRWFRPEYKRTDPWNHG